MLGAHEEGHLIDEEAWIVFYDHAEPSAQAQQLF
jgi:hypothetical protein